MGRSAHVRMCTPFPISITAGGFALKDGVLLETHQLWFLQFLGGAHVQLHLLLSTTFRSRLLTKKHLIRYKKYTKFCLYFEVTGDTIKS